ncbi:protein kinase [Actinomadura syzygii]|uniref:Protein kinase n=1 Tax=Actinomadura syzygii TaxID=1427538 RepID=A0A5D0U3L6_9ACTN|nr:serine/threonine-protein kinase [Actinomadura syzygii]TYC12295.1 protein kinase [Actinomadura syzygii]
MAGPIPLSAADPVRLGGWELLGKIGTGGQGAVYLGRPVEPGTGPSRVAVKLLHAQLLADAGARERFVRELALLQRVAGFCTAQMLAADMAGDRPYIVSEYVPGLSLRALVHEEGPRTGADLDRLAISSVTALTAIHRANVVHRDFKPQNVLMGPDGPRVIDFGIARAFDAGATMTSQVVGTPAYMAPEQFAGRVGPGTDLFAWASTLLFAATGRDPFAGGALPAVMYRIMHETPDLSVLPAPLADVAAACLAKDPKARPTSEDVLLWLLGERERHARLDTATLDGARPGTARLDTATEHMPAPSQHPTARLPQDTPGTRPWEHPGTTPPQPHPGAPGSAAPGQNSLQLQPNSRPSHPAPPTGAPGNAAPGQDAWSTHPEPHPIRPAPSPEPPSAAGSGQAGAWGGTGQVPVAVRRVRRGPALLVGLLLAALLAAVDVLTLAMLIARPSLTYGHRGGLLLVVASSFVLVAIVTLVAAILAWRGSRAAVLTVMAARVARVAMFAAWGTVVRVEAPVLTGHAVLTAVVVLLLAMGLTRSPR